MKRVLLPGKLATSVVAAVIAGFFVAASATQAWGGKTGASAVPTPGHPTATEFVNPLLPSGADPWITSMDGFYYYMNTTGNTLEIWKTRSIADLARAEHKVVWRAPASGPYSHDVWAPELHFLDGRWYIYFAADAGDNASHRIWVVENASRDPLEGRWQMKGKVADATDRWAIDPTILQEHGKLYMLWSGWEGLQDGQQNIYIARLRNPWTIKGKRVRLSSPDHPWEEVGDLPSRGTILAVPHVNVNEGQRFCSTAAPCFLSIRAAAAGPTTTSWGCCGHRRTLIR